MLKKIIFAYIIFFDFLNINTANDKHVEEVLEQITHRKTVNAAGYDLSGTDFVKLLIDKFGKKHVIANFLDAFDKGSFCGADISFCNFCFETKYSFALNKTKYDIHTVFDGSSITLDEIDLMQFCIVDEK